MKKSSFALISAAFILSGPAFPSDLKVEVKGIKNTQALIYLTLWDKPEGFLRTAGKKMTITAQAPSAYAVFSGLPAGEYTLAAYQDINGNKKLDSNFIGIPKEPSGLSNDAGGKFGPPTYDDAKFTVGKENLEIAITLHD